MKTRLAPAVSVVLLVLATPLAAQLVSETETQKLIASSGVISSNTGYSMDIQGDWLVAGAFADSSGYVNQGSVRVFHWNGAKWIEVDKLWAADGGAFDYFGKEVSLDGDALVVGAFQNDFGTPNQGMAYAFRFQGGRFVEEQNLFPSGVSVSLSYGALVAVSDDRAFVYGGFDDSPGLHDQAALFVFHRTEMGWVEDERIELDGSVDFDGYGKSVVVSGNRLVFGDALADVGSSVDQGSVTIYEFADGAWSRQATLVADDGFPGQRFGWAVSQSGERIAVGAFGQDGGVYVFHRESEEWVEEPVVSPPLPPAAGLGASVEIAGSFLAAGADSYDVAGNAEGAAFLFRWNGAAWEPTNMLTASDKANGDLLGWEVALLGPMVVACAPNHHVAGPPLTQGVPYVFDTLPPGWLFRGGGVAGSAGWPVLTGAGELDGGDVVTLALEQCAPAAPVAIVIGLSALQLPFKGGVLVPQPDLLVGGLVTNAAGTLVLSAIWPTLPGGTILYFQEWIVDASAPAGLAASNGLRARVP